jgi:hypothetical protein
VSGFLRAFGGLGLSLAGGVGVVLSLVVWWVVLGGSLVRVVVSIVAVFLRPRGPASPRRGRGVFFLAFIHFGVGSWPSVSNNNNNN